MRLRSLGCFLFLFFSFLDCFRSEGPKNPSLPEKSSSLYSISLLDLSLFLSLFFSCSFNFFAPLFVFSPHTDNKRLDMLSMLITNRLTWNEYMDDVFSSLFYHAMFVLLFYLQSRYLLKWIWYGF